MQKFDFLFHLRVKPNKLYEYEFMKILTKHLVQN